MGYGQLHGLTRSRCPPVVPDLPVCKLTDALIRSLPTPEKRTEYFDTVVPGLALRLTPTGYKSFVYRYRRGSAVKRYTIGPFTKVRLAEARSKARELARSVADGKDPMADKRRARGHEVLTFNDLVVAFRRVHLPSLRPTTRYHYHRQIESELLPVFADLPAHEITRFDIQDLLDAIALDRGAKTMANRVRACLSSIFSFAVRRGLLQTNPARSVRQYSAGDRSRERFYTDREIRALWRSFDSEETTAGTLLKVLLLTGQRRGETSRMRWEDIDGDTWTIPATDAKGKRPHVVPLSAGALREIESLRGSRPGSPFVFDSPVKSGQAIRSELSRPISRVRESSGVDDFRPHDLRRTVATHMASLGVDRTTLGKLLNHKGLSGDGAVTAVYDRYSRLQETREAVTLWEKRLIEIISCEEAQDGV